MILNYEKSLNAWDKASFHSAVKPYTAAEVYQFVFPDTVQHYERVPHTNWFSKLVNVVGFENLLEFDEKGYVKHYGKILAKDSVFYEDNIYDKAYKKRKVYVSLNPILNIGFGYDVSSKKFLTYNLKGLELRADIGKKVTLYTAFLNTVGKFPTYIDIYNAQTGVVPGEGNVRNRGKQGLDFSSIYAYISYSPVKQFNIQVGNGKHFIGDGYRSLLLSDNAYTYPYLQLTANVWRIKYTTIYAELIDNIRNFNDFGQGFPRKLANFNYLSIDAAKFLQIGIFEGITWRRTTVNGNNYFNYNFLNPILGVRGFQKKLEPNTTKVYGLNVKVTCPKYVVLYGQFMINKYGKKNTVDRRMGWQAGVKYFDVGGVKNLNFQMEYNSVRPFTYQGQDSGIGYSHYNQSLAHPMGANFNELLLMANYQYKRFYTSYKMSFIKTAADSAVSQNYGNNILDIASQASNISGIKIQNGIPYKVVDHDLRFGYIINPKINMVIEAKLQFRKYTTNLASTSSLKTNSFMVSFATNIFNRYYDLPVVY
ncbi:MAG: hypothetical protein IT275_04945 [Chitinophagales bacterium]|nr:hypothetical protein [Chitinophagales bacterium]HMY23344.1 hypothetical protein [Chitinophagales bacterium]HNF19889.1 hypothetical protein [Chitinophagales bacterium]HNF52181.1 hypothetical protein [Chitinophagales bacterium]HNJ02206.1 hypothetical protein [Chitinophagales bacterium]